MWNLTKIVFAILFQYKNSGINLGKTGTSNDKVSSGANLTKYEFFGK